MPGRRRALARPGRRRTEPFGAAGPRPYEANRARAARLGDDH
ncbi:hypothetical protein STAFG_5447 [Streptomyces afghaniensis 772]|uniref:Uncharacterized protein n=1 Tax=Streptomyces afghaniensis 772 TaxID=1283301 RepID=S4MUY1_9ACTN|nr:hypothetical protein STAFG_5447 [Streptomyces afghaniensis 772]